MKTLPQPVCDRVAEIALSYTPRFKLSDLPTIRCSKDAFQLFIETWNKDTIEFVEQCRVMLLNRASRVLGICTLSTGSSCGTIIDPKLVFVLAIKTHASRIIVAHNHPSGTLEPSTSDCAMSKKLKAGGALLDVSVEDHLIVTAEGYYSFADEGAL